jgi:uncharacterized membrane protein
MDEAQGDKDSLEARVVALEETVHALERRLSALDVRGASDEATARIDAAADHREPAGLQHGLPAARRAASAQPDPHRSTLRPTISVLTADPGQWANRLGIALVLVGAAFGFKYSIDRGWIGPALRVLCGLGLGATLLFASTLVRATRPGLSRVLAGGGIASAYLSIYAAFHLYAMLSQGASIAAMSLVTIAAFLVAVRSDDAMTATIGTIGGLATPILLSTGSGQVAGLVGYTGAVVAGAGAVFLQTGWRVVLWTAAVGGWLLMAGAADLAERAGRTEAILAETGIVFVALATWWLSVMRDVMAAEEPQRWREATFGFGSRAALTSRRDDWTLQPHQLALATPVVVLGLSTWAWELERGASGWVALSLAAGWALAAAHLRSVSLETAQRLAATHAMGAAVMVAFAITLLLEADAARVGLAVEALAVLVLASRAQGRQPSTIGHLLFLYVSMQTFQHLLEGGRPATVTTLDLADLVVIAALAGAARVLRAAERGPYLVAAQGGLLLWLQNVLAPFDNGATWVTAAWFVNAVALVIAGLRLDSATLRTAGGIVMALTMGKLIVVDMATVDAGIRIVTFLGFGGVLLALGYAFPSLWRRDAGRG